MRLADYNLVFNNNIIRLLYWVNLKRREHDALCYCIYIKKNTRFIHPLISPYMHLSIILCIHLAIPPSFPPSLH